MKRAAVLALALAACTDETVSGYADTGPWRLTRLDGAPVSDSATLTFPQPGRVQGTLPCGPWTAQQTAPYPWFLLSHFETPGRDCPDAAAQERIVHALASVTLAEAVGDVLILSNEEGRELVFRRQ